MLSSKKGKFKKSDEEWAREDAELKEKRIQDRADKKEKKKREQEENSKESEDKKEKNNEENVVGDEKKKDEFPFSCQYCKKKFRRNVHLKEHTKFFHICDICGMIFKKIKSKWNHTDHELNNCPLPISEENYNQFKYIYIHIPKCAGTTINRFLKKHTDHLISSYGTHEDKCIETMNKVTINFGHAWFKNTTIDPKRFITFVRNPYSRVVSLYHFHKLDQGPHSFCEFIKLIYKDRHITNFIKDSSKMSLNCQFELLTNGNNTNVTFSWKNQCAWLPKNNECFFVGKLENLQNDLKRMCDKIEIPFEECDLWLKKKSSGGKDFREYYDDDEVIDIVSQLYAEDIERFGYDFYD